MKEVYCIVNQFFLLIIWDEFAYTMVLFFAFTATTIAADDECQYQVDQVPNSFECIEKRELKWNKF